MYFKDAPPGSSFSFYPVTSVQKLLYPVTAHTSKGPVVYNAVGTCAESNGVLLMIDPCELSSDTPGSKVIKAHQDPEIEGLQVVNLDQFLPTSGPLNYTGQLRDQLALIYSQSSADLTIKVFMIDDRDVQKTLYGFACLAVCVAENAKPQEFVSYVLVLEGSREPFAPLMVQVENDCLPVTRLLNASLLQGVGEVLARRLGVAPMAIDFGMLPRSISPEDKDTVARVAQEIGIACSTSLKIRPQGFRDVSLAQVANKTDFTVELRHDLDVPLVKTLFGDPVRATHEVILRGAQGGVELGRIYGYMDIVNPEKNYLRFIITHLDSKLKYTPGGVLALVAAVGSLRQHEKLWSGIPSEELSSDMPVTVAIGLDIPLFSLDSWYLQPFNAVAQGHTGCAYWIKKAAYDLTGGKVSMQMVYDNQIVVGGEEYLHRGTWVDSEGVQGDLRELELKDEALRQTLNAKTTPTLIQEALLQRWLAQKTSGTAVIQGHLTRVTFSTVFLDTLHKGLESAKVQFTAVN
jgi:hypothetical protein